jgi:hypothetical protein
MRHAPLASQSIVDERLGTKEGLNFLLVELLVYLQAGLGNAFVFASKSRDCLLASLVGKLSFRVCLSCEITL